MIFSLTNVKKSGACLLALLISSTALTKPIPQQADRDVIRQSRDSYYSLRRLGLVELRASVMPNWELFLADETKKNPNGAQAGLKLLRGLHFAMRLDENGKVSLTHQSDNPPPNDEVAKGFDQIYSGIDEMVTGFFQTWSLFMLTSPFPAVESDYQLKSNDSGYILSYKEGQTNVTTLMSKDLIIQQIKVDDSSFVSALTPISAQTAKGVILTGYDANYNPMKGPGKTVLHVTVDYQDVNGLQLPRKVKLSGSYDQQPVNAELTFDRYETKIK